MTCPELRILLALFGGTFWCPKERAPKVGCAYEDVINKRLIERNRNHWRWWRKAPRRKSTCWKQVLNLAPKRKYLKRQGDEGVKKLSALLTPFLQYMAVTWWEFFICLGRKIIKKLLVQPWGIPPPPLMIIKCSKNFRFRDIQKSFAIQPTPQPRDIFDRRFS